MKLKFIPPKVEDPKFKGSLHRTGKIGLTIATAKHFGFNSTKSIQLAVNEEDPNDKNIYGVLQDSLYESGYKIMKGGNYHSINAKSFFDSLGIDCEKANITFNLSDINIDGTKAIKFTMLNHSSSPNGDSVK